MFPTSYETTPCRDYLIDKIAASIRKQRIMRPSDFQGVKKPLSQDNIGYVSFVTPSAAEIPPFAHPMVVVDEDKTYEIYADVRNFTRLDREMNVVVSSRLDYDLMVLRVWFQMIWLKYSPMDMLGLGTYPITVYSRWLSEAVTRRLALPPDAQMKLSVMSAYFYICMFYEPANEMEEKVRFKVATLISRATNVNAQEVLTVIEGLPVFDSAGAFVAALAERTGSVRFNDFNLGLLYSVISGSWFGQNHRELVAVAIEHPPSWMAILVKAVNERGFHNTIIGKVAKMSDKGDLSKTFINNVLNLPAS